jgi:hypothetical protein
MVMNLSNFARGNWISIVMAFPCVGIAKNEGAYSDALWNCITPVHEIKQNVH